MAEASGPAHAHGETRDAQEREVEKARDEQRGGDPHGPQSHDREHYEGSER